MRPSPPRLIFKESNIVTESHWDKHSATLALSKYRKLSKLAQNDFICVLLSRPYMWI